MPTPERGLAVQGQELPNLPGSVRAAFASKKESPAPADPVGPDHGQPDLMGCRGLTDPAVHRGQGCRNLAIVEVMGSVPSSTRGEDDMKHSGAGGAECQDAVLPAGSASCGHDGNSGGCGFRLGQARYLASGRARGLRQASPRARGDLGPGARPAGQALLPTGPLAAERVWDLARASDGIVYAATGDSGKVFRQSTQGGAAWTVALDAADTQALALAATPDGKVLSARGPSGQVIEVTDPQHPASRPDPKVQYIWDLAADAQGNLFAATGPAGQLWKRSRDGKWSLVFDSKATHLLCVALAPDGTVYAGSDGEGLIFRINRDGKVSVLYDAPQSEIRTLLLAPDGSLYAGTAAEAGGGGASRAPSLFSCATTVKSQASETRQPPQGWIEANRQVGRATGTQTPPSSAGGQAGCAQAPGGRFRRAQADLPRRQCRLPDRYRRRDSRDLPHQGADLRPLLVRGPTARRHRPRRAALRGPRPRLREHAPGEAR